MLAKYLKQTSMKLTKQSLDVHLTKYILKSTNLKMAATDNRCYKENNAAIFTDMKLNCCDCSRKASPKHNRSHEMLN